MKNHFYFSRREYFLGKLRGMKRSLTILFNATVAAVVSVLPLAVDAFPQIKGYIPEDIYAAAWVVLVVGNILIRFKTTQDLADK